MEKTLKFLAIVNVLIPCGMALVAGYFLLLFPLFFPCTYSVYPEECLGGVFLMLECLLCLYALWISLTVVLSIWYFFRKRRGKTTPYTWSPRFSLIVILLLLVFVWWPLRYAFL